MAKKNKEQETVTETLPSLAEVPFNVNPAGDVDPLVETAIVPAVETNTALATEQDFDYGDEYQGAEIKLRAEDVIIPMVKIIQEQSRIWKERNEETFTGELGDLYNTVNQQVYSGKKGLLVVPVKELYCVVEKDASPKGTFIARHSADPDVLKKTDPRVLQAFKDNGNSWIRAEGKSADGKTKVKFSYTIEVYCALLSPEDQGTATDVVMIPFAGGSIFPRKVWWSGMGSVLNRPPLYCFRTLLKTVFKPGKEGAVDSYVLDPQPLVGNNWGNSRLPKQFKATLDKCKGFVQLLDSGALGRVDYAGDPEPSESDAEAAAFNVDGKPAF